MKKIMNILMLSCKKATELIEKKSFVGLSFKEKVQLGMHKSMCDACTAYEKQSHKIDEILQSQSNSNDFESTVMHQNDKLKEKIIKELS